MENVLFVRLNLYAKMSVTFGQNPSGQLEIVIFSVNPKCDLSIDQKYFFPFCQQALSFTTQVPNIQL